MTVEFPDLAPERPHWVVRVRTSDGGVAGAGFLIDGGRAITCAHVVNRALGRAPDEASPPTEPVSIDFPMVEGDTGVRARVPADGWVPIDPASQRGDLAVLAIDGTVVDTSQAALRVGGSSFGALGWAIGFPQGFELGVWAEIRVSGPVAHGWRQIDAAGGRPITAGFSGGPVWDDGQEAVIGIVVAADRDTTSGTAFMVPLQQVLDDLPTSIAADVRPVTAHVGPGPVGPGPVASDDERPRPRLLPADIHDFTGRRVEVATLLDRVRSGVAERALNIVAVSGQGGVGKSALTVHVAHELAEEFPDGQLYVDLRSAESFRRLEPPRVLAMFLRHLGVAGPLMAATEDGRSAQYRDRISGRRMLVILDNADDERQVRPLLPGDGGCGVIVTSRRALAGLAGDHVPLDVLQRDDAVELLGVLAGRDRVTTEPEAAVDVVDRCGRLPLAVRIVGARLRAKSHWTLARMKDRLSDERSRLDELAVGDLEVRASFDLSYVDCPPELQRAFYYLAASAVPELKVWHAAAILQVEERTAEDLMESLVERQLMQAVTAGDGQIVYGFHDLLRLFGQEQQRTVEPEAVEHISERLGAAMTEALDE
ncbi:MAG: NB-ARC domain-containing protein [Actinomycetota bacterium]